MNRECEDHIVRQAADLLARRDPADYSAAEAQMVALVVERQYLRARAALAAQGAPPPRAHMDCFSGGQKCLVNTPETCPMRPVDKASQA